MKLNGLFANTFENRTILLTGHTGFKGSWLSIWLAEMGANVVGYSLKEPPTVPSNFELAKVSQHIVDVRGDICDYQTLRETLEKYKPELVIHFAAQTTVLPSYENPRISFETNVGGTVNVLEAIRTTNTVKAAVVCTTDKVYENKEWVWGYRENDRLGGHDPYSTSKAMAELATSSYRKSFFAEQPNAAIGTVRAGNVIGGGDFTEFGLIADCMRSLMNNQPIELRNPYSIRPWQYVLEPLSGYLCLAAKLLQAKGHQYAEAWNFGPLQHKGVTTRAVAEQLISLWGSGSWINLQAQTSADTQPHETRYLHLNWDKAAALLNWRPALTLEQALAETVRWYKAYKCGNDMYQVALESIDQYAKRAGELQLEWARVEP